MPKFRKKPVKIEAELASNIIESASHNWSDLPKWFKDQYEAGNAIILPDKINIVTLEGTMIAQKDDWVICGVNGEIYPCKPDIFQKTYEPIES